MLMYVIFVLFIQALKLSHPKDFDFESFSEGQPRA